MATDRATLLDIAKQTDPDGAPAMVAEVLVEKAEMLQDGPSVPSNAQMGNRVTIRSSLPTVGFGRVNQGVARSKSSTKQHVDTIAIIRGLSEVDALELDIVGQAAFDAWRAGEDRSFLESMAQKAVETALYGDEDTDDSAFTGLAARMAALAGSIYGSIVKSAGAIVGGDGTSMYIVDWGKDGVEWIHPKNATRGRGGVDAQDLGKQRVTDAEGNPFMAFVTEYLWMLGLTVHDPRHMARLANIDLSDAQLAAPTQGVLVDKLVDILTAMPKPNGLQRVIYCHREIEAAFHKQAMNKANLALSMGEYLGQMTPMFWGYPIRGLDRISKAESAVA